MKGRLDSAAMNGNPKLRATSTSTPSVLELIRGRGLDAGPTQLTRGALYTFINPHSYAIADRIGIPYREFDGLYVDGILLSLALRTAGIHLRRRSFDMVGIAPDVFALAGRLGAGCYFIGARPGEIEPAVDRIGRAWPSMSIVGHRHGYFENASDRRRVIDGIVDLEPALVVAGMGAPLQERFLVDLRAAGWWGTGFTCGGFLHQLVDRLDYYPAWIDRFQLRWLYRGLTDRRVARRLVTTYPEFVRAFTRDATARRLPPDSE